MRILEGVVQGPWYNGSNFIMWVIWQEHNDLIFNHDRWMTQKMYQMIGKRLAKHGRRVSFTFVNCSKKHSRLIGVLEMQSLTIGETLILPMIYMRRLVVGFVSWLPRIPHVLGFASLIPIFNSPQSKFLQFVPKTQNL